MPRTKKRNRRRNATSRTSLPAGMRRVKGPETRLKPMFELLVEVSRTAEEAILAVEIPEQEGEKRLLMFDVGVLLRGSNALKAARALCGAAHWEFAAPILRQLFELAINMEHLARQPDREAAIFRYSKYALFQGVRHQHRTLLYEQKTGRPIDTQRLSVLEQMLDQTFPEFRWVDDKGKLHQKPSWSGHDARYLAEKSKHPLRADQYDLLFSTWSEQAHAAPAALIDNMFPRGLPAEQIVASDDAEIIQTVTMAITFFLELWMLLPNVPQVDPAQRLEWTNKMIDEARKHGAPFPTPSDPT